jgi:hypothetical protein
MSSPDITLTATLVALAVEAQEVVQWGAENGDWGKEFKRAMRSVPVVAVEEGREACGAF